MTTLNESINPIVIETVTVANAQDFLSVDTTQAREMLTLLGYTENDTVFGRILPAKVKPLPEGYKKDEYRKNITFKLSSIPTTQNYNKALYIVVNGQGQKKADITHGRALFIEFDDLKKEDIYKILERLESLGFPKPSLIIETRNSLHIYWVFTVMIPITEWENLQQDMINFIPECDPTIKDAPRLMRLAGAWHTQINGETGEILEPFRCNIVGGTKEKYDFELLRKLVPVHIKPEKKVTTKKQPIFLSDDNQVMNDSERDRRLALEILSQLPPSADGDHNYDIYREIGVVFKNILGESEAISVMKNHSPGRNWEQIISSSTGSHDMGTIVFYANQMISGWVYPEWWKKSFPKPQNNVTSINKNKPKDFQSNDLTSDLKALLDEGLRGSKLLAEKTAIAKKHGLSSNDVDKHYQALLDESEIEESRDANKAEILSLVNAQNKRLDITTYIPQVAVQK